MGSDVGVRVLLPCNGSKLMVLRNRFDERNNAAARQASAYKCNVSACLCVCHRNHPHRRHAFKAKLRKQTIFSFLLWKMTMSPCQKCAPQQCHPKESSVATIQVVRFLRASQVLIEQHWPWSNFARLWTAAKCQCHTCHTHTHISIPAKTYFRIFRVVSLRYSSHIHIHYNIDFEAHRHTHIHTQLSALCMFHSLAASFVWMVRAFWRDSWELTLSQCMLNVCLCECDCGWLSV